MPPSAASFLAMCWSAPAQSLEQKLWSPEVQIFPPQRKRSMNDHCFEGILHEEIGGGEAGKMETLTRVGF